MRTTTATPANPTHQALTASLGPVHYDPCALGADPMPPAPGSAILGQAGTGTSALVEEA